MNCFDNVLTIISITFIFHLLSVYKRFKELDPKRIPAVMSDNDAQTITIPMDKMLKMQELKVNHKYLFLNCLNHILSFFFVS